SPLAALCGCYLFRLLLVFFFSSRSRHTRFSRDWSSDVCSSDLYDAWPAGARTIAFLLLFCGGMAGSTAGGLKVIRLVVLARYARSEERRVGKEWRSRRSRDHLKNKMSEEHHASDESTSGICY